MPWASKVKVLASASAPWGGSSWPFQRKVTPAALPTRTTSSLEKRNVGCAGAMRVSWVTSCPSEVTEIQEFSVARTTRLRVAAGFSVGAVVAAPKERMVTSPFFSTLT